MWEGVLELWEGGGSWPHAPPHPPSGHIFVLYMESDFNIK